MKKYIAILLSLIFCISFASCAQTKYDDSLSCSDIATALDEEFLGTEEYEAYEESDIKYMFNSDDFDSCRILYSISSDDIGEIGVLHAKDAQGADKLLDEVNEYIEDIKEEKSDFLRNYLPEEFKKLDNARVKRFGNYVIYTVLEPEQSQRIFERAKEILTK